MKRPPYARELIANRKAGRYVNPWLFAGRGAWELASRRGPGRLVLPAGEDPAQYDWRCVSCLDVVVRWPGATVPEIEAAGALLVRSGARSVLILPEFKGDPIEGRTDCLRPHRRFIPAWAAT